jgi:hypothetical protein
MYKMGNMDIIGDFISKLAYIQIIRLPGEKERVLYERLI